VKPVPEAALGAVRETLREHGEPVAAGAMTFVQARTANEVLKAQERRVRLQRMKSELVDRAKAVAQVFRLARDERDAWVKRAPPFILENPRQSDADLLLPGVWPMRHEPPAGRDRRAE
jgi:hypothetical protein